jgi:hypothetical protein
VEAGGLDAGGVDGGGVVVGELRTGLGVLDGGFGVGTPPREPPGECVGFGVGPLPRCPPGLPLPGWPRPPCDRCLPAPGRAAEGGGMKKPGSPGYPGAQCAVPPLVTRGPRPGSVNGMPDPLRLGVLVAGSPVAGDVIEPNITSSGSDDPPARRASATAMAAGTTSAPRHAASGQAARRGFLGARTRGGGLLGAGLLGGRLWDSGLFGGAFLGAGLLGGGARGDGSGGDGAERAATGHPSGRVTWLARGRVSTAARTGGTGHMGGTGGTAAKFAEAAGTRSGGTETAWSANPGTTRSGRVTRETVRRDCMTAPIA